MPITVPMVSKKSESMIEKIVTTAVITPDARRRPRSSKPAPRLEKSGRRHERRAGSPPGREREARGPPVAALTTMARTVVTRMPDQQRAAASRGPAARRVSRRPTSATATGAAVSSPSVTGTPGGPGFTMPAVTEADEEDEEADADADRPLQRQRDGVHDRLAEAGEDQRR